MTDDLYSKPINGAEFRQFCGGNQQEENNESCVSFASIPGGVVLRDTKAPGRELRFSDNEMAAFVTGYAAEHGLTL